MRIKWKIQCLQIEPHGDTVTHPHRHCLRLFSERLRPWPCASQSWEYSLCCRPSHKLIFKHCSTTQENPLTWDAPRNHKLFLSGWRERVLPWDLCEHTQILGWFPQRPVLHLTQQETPRAPVCVAQAPSWAALASRDLCPVDYLGDARPPKCHVLTPSIWTTRIHLQSTLAIRGLHRFISFQRALSHAT